MGTTALATARLIGQAHASDILEQQTARSGRNAEIKSPLEVRTQVWVNPDLVSVYFMNPGEIGIIFSSAHDWAFVVQSSRLYKS